VIIYGSSQNAVRGDARGKAKLRKGQMKKHLSPTAPILSVHKDIGHGSIVDILAVCTRWKESSMTPSVVTQQVPLFAYPAVPEFLGA
jgi:hypothetical protein